MGGRDCLDASLVSQSPERKRKMTRELRSLVILPVMALTLLASSCTRRVAPEDVYRHSSGYKGSSWAMNVRVQTQKDGTFSITALEKGRGSSVPMEFALGGDPGKGRYFPDALGSKNIEVAINKDVGYTRIAGLEFTQQATLNIWKDGVVELDREGVKAKDTKNGTSWVSARVKIDGKVAIVMVRDKS